jgi:transcriptional regulator PpsR
MSLAASPASAKNLIFPRGRVPALDAPLAGRIVAAGADIAMVIDVHGVICDMALSSPQMAREGFESWLDRPWSDTVAPDSKHKVAEMLRDAFVEGKPRWREVNQLTPDGASVMLRYCVFGAGAHGDVIVIGRDDRVAAAMQQRMLQAQQSLEREYSKLRDAEFRYRILFQTCGEAVVIVDAATKTVVEANPAAERLFGSVPNLVGSAFAKHFEPGSQDAAASVVTGLQLAAPSRSSPVIRTKSGEDLQISASLFRNERTSQCLVRLIPSHVGKARDAEAGPDLQSILERMPDAFLVTDDSLNIVAANLAFLDLVGLGTTEQAIGQPLGRFLGRANFDLNILVDSLKAHSSVRNYGTVLRNQLDQQEDVEISAVSAPHKAGLWFGLTIRPAPTLLGVRANNAPDLRRSVEQMTQLVGRVTLKELVRETTELVERLCIEAALVLTNDNRASAADVLGLSRQSLYLKLHRLGLGNLGNEDE